MYITATSSIQAMACPRQLSSMNGKSNSMSAQVAPLSQPRFSRASVVIRSSKKVNASAQPASKGASAPKSTPKISAEDARELYRDMFLGREFEEMCAQMYYRGKMFGFVHLYSGQEAVSTGVIKACLKKHDFVSSTYRDHVHAISKGVSSRKVMAELFGKKTGVCRGQGGSMHMFDKEHGLLGGYAFIGEGIPVGVGAAFTSAYTRRVLGEEDHDAVAVNFFGDGTCNVGQFYESLNMASLYKLPVIFVVENNKWAIGMSHARATSTSSLADSEPWIYKKGEAFGMPGVHVDGMDVLKVREVAMEAVARARRGDGPTLIECETYRFRGHSLADPDELRDPKEKEHYAARDPIPRMKEYMLKNGLATEAEIKEIEKDVVAEVEDAVEFADESPKPDMSQLLENVFADPKGFGIGPDGQYRYMQPGFTSGTAAVS